jgi:hypothetical protein
MMYHALVRPVRPRLVAAGAAASVLLFLVAGVVRNGGQPVSLTALNPFEHASEFDVIFGNAMDLHARIEHGELGTVPSAVYAADLLALVPQQFSPVAKVDPTDWYVSTFYPSYAAIGGGLAFGTTAEAVLTGGLTSAIARGMVIGVLFAALYRLYLRRAYQWPVFVLYVWTTALGYQTFRGTTLYLVVLFAYRFLPAVVGVMVLSKALDRAARAAQ